MFKAGVPFAKQILEIDADETLLELLARDTEPIYKPDKPHRRYVNPPMHHGIFEYDCYGARRRVGSDWEQVAYDGWTNDWWVKKGDSYGRTSETRT